MAAFLTIKDGIRDLFRKHDEVVTPILRFIAALVVFYSINLLFGFSDLFNRGIVVLLLAVLCAVMPDSFMFFVAGVVMCVHSFCVSMEVGAVFVVLIVAIYCLYIRFFPKYAFVILLVPICYLLHISCLVPLIVAIVAGIAGIIPMAFGTIIFYFAQYATEVKQLISTAGDDEEISGFSYLVDALLKNKEMMLAIAIFAITIIVVYLIYRMSFDYSWYVAIAIGGVVNIIFYLLGGYLLDVSVSIATVVFGTLVGMIIACIVQFCKGVVDYPRTEVVQFEDDDFYYYVKAIPKLKVSSSNVNVKNVNSGNANNRGV